jgi:protein-disulfide isomerase
VVTADDPAFGPPQAQAKVTVVEFADYECPYCQQASSIVRSLSLKYQSSVRFIIRDFPLSQIHPDALAGAEAAGCAEEQGKFWPMYDRLFAQNGTLARTNLDQAAASIGLDSKAFDQCLDSHRRLPEIRADQADGTKAGVVGTPTFFINGQRIAGVIPQDTFEQIITAALGGQNP